MDRRADIREFLSSRRARLTPEQAGLPSFGGTRRVAGLRREEVAMLAGVSADYYVKVERGNLAGVSDSVLGAIADALQLDEAERAHLFDLARSVRTPTSRRRRSTARTTVRPNVRRILELMTEAPAYVRNGRFDVLAANRLGRALFADAYPADGAGPAETFNLARYLFLNDGSRSFYVEWETVARDVVGSLRIEAGRMPYDKALTDLIGELVTRSEEFRRWWAAHDVKLHRRATKRVVHRVAGEMELTGEALHLPGDELTMIAYTFEAGGPSAEAVAFLGSWLVPNAGADDVIADHLGRTPAAGSGGEGA